MTCRFCSDVGNTLRHRTKLRTCRDAVLRNGPACSYAVEEFLVLSHGLAVERHSYQKRYASGLQHRSRHVHQFFVCPCEPLGILFHAAIRLVDLLLLSLKFTTTRSFMSDIMQNRSNMFYEHVRILDNDYHGMFEIIFPQEASGGMDIILILCLGWGAGPQTFDEGGA